MGSSMTGEPINLGPVIEIDNCQGQTEAMFKKLIASRIWRDGEQIWEQRNNHFIFFRKTLIFINSAHIEMPPQSHVISH